MVRSYASSHSANEQYCSSARAKGGWSAADTGVIRKIARSALTRTTGKLGRTYRYGRVPSVPFFTASAFGRTTGAPRPIISSTLAPL